MSKFQNYLKTFDITSTLTEEDIDKTLALLQIYGPAVRRTASRIGEMEEECYEGRRQSISDFINLAIDYDRDTDRKRIADRLAEMGHSMQLLSVMEDALVLVKDTPPNGGTYPNILFAIDGEVYDFNGNSCIVIGGAYSVDKYYRLARGWSWFPDEQPSEEIKAKVERVLAERNWKIDIVLSHTGPLKYEPTEVFLPMIDQSTVDKSTEVWLEQIEAKLDYERWYFAHYHTEKEVGKIRIMHNDYTMIPHEASVAAEKDMIRRMHRQAEIAEALGLLDDAPNQKNGDDIS